MDHHRLIDAMHVDVFTGPLHMHGRTPLAAKDSGGIEQWLDVHSDKCAVKWCLSPMYSTGLACMCCASLPFYLVGGGFYWLVKGCGQWAVVVYQWFRKKPAPAPGGVP